MHVVIWTIKGQRYATPSSTVIEVVPLVQSRPVPESQPWLAGMFDFRGSLLPLVETSRLLGYEPSVHRMANRILVIDHCDESNTGERRLGLIVEQVIGSESLDFDGANVGPSNSKCKFLGPVAKHQGSTVQLTIPSQLPSLRA